MTKKKFEVSQQETVEAVKTAFSEESTTETAEEPKTLVYCGPTIKNGALTQYSVYRGVKLPVHIQEYIMECPAIDNLFVKPVELTGVRHNLKEAGSFEHQLFQKVLDYANGGK